MSAELTALEAVAENNITAWFRLSAQSQAVLFYATNYLTKRKNWYNTEGENDVSDEDWDTIQAYVDNLLYEAKNPMIGMILPFATEVLPPNVLLCDGSIVAIADYPELYAVIDPNWYNDEETFMLPDLRGRTVLGTGTNGDIGGHDISFTGGSERVVLDVDAIPSHHHTIPLTATTLAVEPGEVTVLTPVPFFTQDTGDTGGGLSHENMQPWIALHYGIVAS